MDESDPEANFGTGMAYLMEEKFREAELSPADLADQLAKTEQHAGRG